MLQFQFQRDIAISHSAGAKHAKLSFTDLKKMGVVLKRALYFITCDGRMMYNTKLDESYITRHLIYNERPDTMLLADNKSCTYEQMSIFDFISG